MKGLYFFSAIALSLSASLPAIASPEQDRQDIRHFFEKRFPQIDMAEYGNGVYALVADAREQWEEIEEFPPYEDAVDEGQTLFDTPFANGKSYTDCFPNGGIGIKQDYPKFDQETGQVITIEYAINQCRQANDETPLPYGKGELAYIAAYMAETSRDNIINVVIPEDPRALAAYEAGKRLFYERRGQLNLACATCHISASGQQLRAEITSPALGHTTHFPAFRFKWDDIGTLQRRYAGCNTQVRAKPFALQSEQYRNLEYFHTYMANGLPLNGPSSRK